MSRTEQIKTERRRRNGDGLSGKRKRLGLDESKLDRENFEYYLAKDAGNRIHDLTVNDDWDIVQDREGDVKANDGSGTGSEVSVHTGDGGRHVLLRKPKQFYIDDKAASQRRIDDQEAAILGGAVPGGDMSGTYVPDKKDGPMTMKVEGQSAAPQIASRS